MNVQWNLEMSLWSYKVKNKIVLDAFAKKVLDTIEKSGGKVYIVGGLVRDLFIKNQLDYHDVDVEVYGLTVEQLQTVLAKFGKVDEIGKSFGILKLLSLPNFDFALPRIESKIGASHQDFEVIVDKDLDLQKATSRRDITMNALLYEYSSDTIIDLYGGIKDIQHRCIKMVNPKTFKEDPLRVLRIAQFASRFEFFIDGETKQFCRNMVKAGMLETLSNERVYQEYCKMLMAPRPSIGLQFLSDIQALPKFLEALKHTNQRQDYHPEGNVWNHTLLVVDMAALVKERASTPLGFMWACLLHDIGKPKVTTKEGHAPGHNEAGVVVFCEQCCQLITSSKLQKYLKTMIYYHMHLMNMTRNHARDIKYLRLLKAIDGVVPIEDLILISKCDKLGRLRDSHESVVELDRYMQDKRQRLGSTAKKPVVTGEDLLTLGFLPSKQFTQMLEEAYEKQLQGIPKDKILKFIKKEY